MGSRRLSLSYIVLFNTYPHPLTKDPYECNHDRDRSR